MLMGVQASHMVFPEFQSLAATTVRQLHRTAYHFQPPMHWINGPMYYKGFYHLFYQYNPKGSVWGNIIWAHSISKDLVNWESLDPAIEPSEPFDIKGTWSGSATLFPGDKVVMYYTGIDAKEQQLQNYAIPKDPLDPYLHEWIKPKEGNPMVVPDHEINGSSFRDPTTAWQANGYWHILVGSRKNDIGVAYLFKSKDQKTWVKAPHPLHQVPGTGNWECPDFYPVSVKTGLDTSVQGKDVKHVLKVSLDATRYDYYTIGTYFPDQDKYVPDQGLADGWDGLRFDYGNFYASKSFFDPVKHRRILWGWSNESDTKLDDVKKGWAGIQLIPRTVLLDPSGKQLVQWPVEEIETLRGSKIDHMGNLKLETGKPVKLFHGITGAQADVVVGFSIPNMDKAEPFDPSWKDPQDLCFKKKSVQGAIGPFGLMVLASEKLEEYTPVYFRIFKAKDNKPVVLMCSDEEPSTLKTDVYRPMYGAFVDADFSDKKLSLRSLIDHSVVENFAEGGKTVLSNRVYPTIAVLDMAHVFAFNNGTEPITLEHACGWNMQRPQRMNN
ncbi:hypothetical protein V6N13_072903 [Hibiscus sabdariffa]|uniref:Beta-fructofuranosidase n=1 Tax=Hibiscus sabdariffa TaxID=183260 RepID=A0ABR2E922_9ROSI